MRVICLSLVASTLCCWITSYFCHVMVWIMSLYNIDGAVIVHSLKRWDFFSDHYIKQYCPSKVDHPQTAHRHAFCFCDTDFDLMIFIYKLDMKILKMYLYSKNKKLRQRGENSASDRRWLPVSTNSEDSTQVDYKCIIQLFRNNFAIKTTGVWKHNGNIYSYRINNRL